MTSLNYKVTALKTWKSVARDSCAAADVPEELLTTAAATAQWQTWDESRRTGPRVAITFEIKIKQNLMSCLETQTPIYRRPHGILSHLWIVLGLFNDEDAD